MATKKKAPEKAVLPAPEPKPAPKALTRDEEVKAWTAPQKHDLDDLLEKGDLVARYLEQHGQWETGVHNTHLGLRQVRTLRYCACPICTDARAALKLTD
jgi:hypothetical protein